MPIPKFDDLFNPLLEALRNLGGSGSVAEIDSEVSDILKLTEEEVSEIHLGNRTKISYRLAWARNYLKRFGLLENSSRGIWALTSKGNKILKVDKEEVKRHVRSLDQISSDDQENLDISNKDISWEEKIISKLQKISPDSFERLCQRLLREAGFIQVEVTGRSGDGGIDGTGIMRIGGFISFHIIFQCKRYQGSVSSQQIRDFRGAMMGRADKGLFMTTGTFTRDARKEATRDGAPPIDLFDGNELVKKMKDLNLGVIIETEEIIDVDNEWFDDFS